MPTSGASRLPTSSPPGLKTGRNSVAVVLRFHLMVCYHVHHLGLQGDTLADHGIAIILNDYIAGVLLASAAVTSTGYAFTASTSGNKVPT